MVILFYYTRNLMMTYRYTLTVFQTGSIVLIGKGNLIIINIIIDNLPKNVFTVFSGFEWSWNLCVCLAVLLIKLSTWYTTDIKMFSSHCGNLDRYSYNIQTIKNILPIAEISIYCKNRMPIWFINLVKETTQKTVSMIFWNFCNS